VDDPAGLALDLVEAVRPDGCAIFANCFYPVIKCHLQRTFYLRYQFKRLMTHAGLEFVARIPRTEHAYIFQRRRPIDRQAFARANAWAKVTGPTVNALVGRVALARRMFRWPER
jgi:2-polyprenyl-6-hydroxyphenyl methylase/3-demethylubiquinone-9 3-methyltransferase